MPTKKKNYPSLFSWILAATTTYLLATYCEALDPGDVVIVISSQSNGHHVALLDELRRDVDVQSRRLEKRAPVIQATHVDFGDVVGAWTVLPLVPKLYERHQRNCSWFFFGEDRTSVRLEKLLKVLEKYDHEQEVWLGQALRDAEPTIIHHFAFSENTGSRKKFAYPNTLAGFAISRALLEKLKNRWDNRQSSLTTFSDFSIDHAHELALFVWDDRKGTALTHEPSFCIEDNDDNVDCATVSRPSRSCESSLAEKNIFFAVKTCRKFHRDRVINVVKKTWGSKASRIEYFSDVADVSIPTLDLGIPNTEHGHCGKTLAIIRHVADKINSQELDDIRWVLIVDDDTILR